MSDSSLKLILLRCVPREFLSHVDRKLENEQSLCEKPDIVNVNSSKTNITFVDTESRLERERSTFLFAFSESNITFKIHILPFRLISSFAPPLPQIGLTEQYYLRRASILSYIRNVSRKCRCNLIWFSLESFECGIPDGILNPISFAFLRSVCK